MSYQDHQTSQYANRSQEETGISTTTGCPTVTDEAKDEPAAFVFDGKTKPVENENFTVASSSQAQSVSGICMETQSYITDPSIII